MQETGNPTNRGLFPPTTVEPESSSPDAAWQTPRAAAAFGLSARPSWARDFHRLGYKLVLQHHTLCPLARQEGTGGGAVPNQERLNILTNSRQTSICILRAIVMSHVHFALQRRLEN